MVRCLHRLLQPNFFWLTDWRKPQRRVIDDEQSGVINFRACRKFLLIYLLSEGFDDRIDLWLSCVMIDVPSISLSDLYEPRGKVLQHFSRKSFRNHRETPVLIESNIPNWIAWRKWNRACLILLSRLRLPIAGPIKSPSALTRSIVTCQHEPWSA